jgi:hypothetical protein
VCFSSFQYNVDAASTDEKSEMLKAGTWCYADDLGTEMLECDGRAQRTQRAGVYELRHWLRQDRRYCESSFFRSRIVPDSDALHSAETCRVVVATRNETCYKECDVCGGFCSSGLARAIKDAVKCTVDLPLLGINAAAHSSDAGQQIAYGHGAIRTKGRPYTPYTGYLEQFDILVNNDIDRPRVNRDSVSCRRPHRESRTGAFVPGLETNGKPRKRSGFMVCAPP